MKKFCLTSLILLLGFIGKVCPQYGRSYQYFEPLKIGECKCCREKFLRNFVIYFRDVFPLIYKQWHASQLLFSLMKSIRFHYSFTGGLFDDESEENRMVFKYAVRYANSLRKGNMAKIEESEAKV